MQQRWLTIALLGLVISIALSLLALTYIILFSPFKNPIIPSTSSITRPHSPEDRRDFEQDKRAYEKIDSPGLKLPFTPPLVQLPDLRSYLNYYGTNERPDAGEKRLLLHFNLAGNQEIQTIPPGQPLYLTFERAPAPGRYRFSNSNEPTNLWITAEKFDNSAQIAVRARDANGKEITEPESRAAFSLQEKEYNRPTGEKWEIGKWRVDGTLLARQKARWYGQDHFLNDHGGAEFAEIFGRERIEFGDKDQKYQVFLGPDECLIWKEDRWQQVIPSYETRSFPLLCLKKVEERLMKLDLWDVGGKGKISLNVLKSTEAWAPQLLQKEIRFISARTLSQYVMELRGQRMTLRPNDWLLLSEEGWKPLESAEEIDQFVDREKTGILLVFDGIVKKDDRQYLQITLYNTTRTDSEIIEIPLDQSGGIFKPAAPPIEESETEEEFSPNQWENPLDEIRVRSSESVLKRPETQKIQRSVPKSLEERLNTK